jgi:hypothetical protein
MNGQIFQIHYDSQSRSKIDPAFIPFDNSGCKVPEEREIYVFKHAVEPLMPFTTDHVGFLSWKFAAKTGVEGSAVKDFLGTSDSVDVLLINPFCEDAVVYRNPWHQAVKHHPKLLGLARKIYTAAGYDANVLDEIFEAKRVCYCNYFTANQPFWSNYLQFIRKLEAAIGQLDAEDARTFNSRADGAIDANHYSFFFERCLSTYLQMRPEVKVAAIDLLTRPGQEERLAKLRDALALRSEIDAADGASKQALMSRLDAWRQAHYGGGSTFLFDMKYRFKYFLEHKLPRRLGR